MLLVRQAEIYAASARADPSDLVDVRCRKGKIIEIGSSLHPEPEEITVDARGGALLPGLHDHHIHLLALAASQQSIACGPPGLNNEESLARVLQEAHGSGWIRGTGYHESVAGMLHREQLDEWVSDRPLKIQHRSGKMWFVNSLAARLLDLDKHRSLEGVECDSNGKPTGRLFRLDQWLREQLADETLPDIKAVSQLLASYGVTGVTDATPGNSSSTWNLFKGMMDKGDLLQRVLLMGDQTLTEKRSSDDDQEDLAPHLLDVGSLKIMLDDYALPEFEILKKNITDAHRLERSVAIHCVTAVELVYALSALHEAGAHAGDRIEHAAIASTQTIPLMADTGITVVSQPGFIAEKGDQYLADVDARDHQDLYRTATLINAGIPVGGSTDAPFGSPDPWKAMTAAVSRKTLSGATLGEDERLTPELALQLFTSSAANPGGSSRCIEVGSDADFCLLNKPWQVARLRLNHEDVIATIRAGQIIYPISASISA